ncbi:unnamed protein product, partial [Heterosigma akashiwo]
MVPHEDSHSQPQHEHLMGCDFFSALLDSFSPGGSPTPGSPQSHQHLHMLGHGSLAWPGGSPYAGPAPVPQAPPGMGSSNCQGGWGMPQVAPGAPAGIHSMPHLDLNQ